MAPLRKAYVTNGGVEPPGTKTGGRYCNIEFSLRLYTRVVRVIRVNLY
jgi:hypothetical protein